MALPAAAVADDNSSKTIPMKKEKRREHEPCKQGMETQEKYWLGIG